jgi:murein DD-endopeptidase MepM/ murein hydrolase activator NlpD
MEIQFHPASPRGRVRTIVLGDRGEKAMLSLVGLAAVSALSLWFSVPIVAVRALHEERREAVARQLAAARRDHEDAAKRAAGLRARALEAGDLLSRIAFLYGVPTSDWPRILNPETGALASAEAERTVYGLGRFLVGLERGRAVLEGKEAADSGLAERTPSLMPVESDLVEPSAFFGPRISPWTGAEEFFRGLNVAAPAGSAVIAPAAATVVFVGRVKPSARSSFWRFGNVLVLSHGSAGATLYGHLAKVDVRRGQRVSRGQRLGTVGQTGWAVSPVLHYEFWRRSRGELSPTDPRFAILDRRWPGLSVSLERMLATAVPGDVGSLPGL